MWSNETLEIRYRRAGKKKLDGSELQSGITPIKREDLGELDLAKGMKSVLLWWR